MVRLTKKQKLKLEQSCISKLFLQPENQPENAILREFYQNVAVRWRGIVDPKTATIQELSDEFYRQYIDREARWFKSLFELCIVAYSPLKKEYHRQGIDFTFDSPKALFNHFLEEDVTSKQTTKKIDHRQKYNLSKNLVQIANGDRNRVKFISQHLENVSPSQLKTDLFRICMRKSTKGLLRDRWEDFQIATVRVAESLNVYHAATTHQKQIKLII